MTERILLVDDEPMVCEVLQLVLAQQGFDALAVHTAAAARAAAHGDFAGALIDKNLPDGNGVELLVELRALLPDAALLIMTGYSSFDTAVQAMRTGASDYLVKPFSTMDEVGLRLRKAIDTLRGERERVQLAGQLDEARNELAAIFEAADEPILIFDLDGRIRRRNGAATRLYADAEPGRTLLDLGDVEGGAAIARCLGGEVVRRERVVRRGAAGPTTFAATLAPIVDHRGRITALVETALSIDETLRAQRVLHQADKMATLGALAATLAHELANPISCALSNMSVFGDIDAEGRVIGTDPAEAAEIIKEVRASLGHARELIRRTRQFSAPQRSTEPLPVGLAQVAAEAVGFVGPQLGHKVRLVCEVPEGLRVAGDRTGLLQVLLNLLINAGHALRGRPSPRIVIAGRLADGDAFLTVSDNGCGIPSDELPHIFDRFFTTKPVDQGTGLGLAVCRDVVRAHGGSLRVESEVGSGTIFEIRLPACADDAIARTAA